MRRCSTVKWCVVALSIAIISTPARGDTGPVAQEAYPGGLGITAGMPGETRSKEGSGGGLSGSAGIFAKYNSNLELVDAKIPGQDLKDAYIGEPTVHLKLAETWGPDWWLDLELSGQADVHADHAKENWYLGRGFFSLIRARGENSVGLASETRYVTSPEKEEFDFIRHTGLLSYKRVISPLWQVRVGGDNVLTRYPHNRNFDYSMNGFSAEIRNTWDFDFSTYYSYDYQAYRGSFDPQENNPNSSPGKGFRHTGGLGFDWVIFSRQSLSGTYHFQVDRSEAGVYQIGDFEGHEDSQDNEAEFALTKHKATLLYSCRLNHRLTLSSYAEWIHKDFDNNHLSAVSMSRDDALFLSSTHLKFGCSDNLSLKLRYLFRTNHSSLDSQDYQDYILLAGPEYRF